MDEKVEHLCPYSPIAKDYDKVGVSCLLSAGEKPHCEKCGWYPSERERRDALVEKGLVDTVYLEPKRDSGGRIFTSIPWPTKGIRV